MPWVENVNILSTGWFIFFLLIFLIGYIFVEIILWEDYPFRKNIEKYDNNLFDRIIHYITLWIILNIWYLILCYISNWINNLNEIFNTSWLLWEILTFTWKVDALYTKDFQFIFFSIINFCILLIILISFILVLKVITKIGKSGKYFFDKIKKLFKSK